MKFTLTDFWFFFLAFICVWPWMIGCVDLLGLFFVDHTVTGIVWNDGKAVFALFYPIVTFTIFAGAF